MPRKEPAPTVPQGEPGKCGVFISWSGDQSRRIAEGLHQLIPDVFQDVATFVSSNDIDAGSTWSTKILVELGVTEFGIICLTPDNLMKPWIHFEAGALAKRVMDKAKVVPYLWNLSSTDVAPPLSLFQ